MSAIFYIFLQFLYLLLLDHLVYNYMLQKCDIDICI